MISSQPSWPDLILIALMILYTLYSAVTFRRTRAQMTSGELSRKRVYTEIIGVQWLAVAMLTLIWWLGSRPLGNLGLPAQPSQAAETPWLVGAWGVSLLGCIYLLYQIWLIGRDAELRRKVRDQIADFDVMLPRTPGEAWGFSAVGLTAGICEELLYRGFLLWWCQAALGLNLLWAGILSTVLFGLGHAYQGWTGILRTGLVGAALLLIRLAAGSLWPAILLHAAADIFGGWMVYRARLEVDNDGPSPYEAATTPSSAG